MHEGDRHAALADRRRDALDGAGADVAAREDARDARLEEVGVAVEIPASAAVTSEPVSTKPRRSSAISGGSHAVSASAPMKMKSPPDSSRVVSPVSPLRTSIASSESSPCAATTSVLAQHSDVRPRRELVDQVARHALLEPLAAAEDGHAARVGREEHAPPARPSCRRRRRGRRGRGCSAPRCARRRRRCPCRRAGRIPRSPDAATRRRRRG